MQVIKGISYIYQKYDAFLVDQWGVLHGGLECYEGARDALELLSKSGKVVIIGTNSSKSIDRNIDRLYRDFDINSTLYTNIVSSADILCRHVLAEKVNYKRILIIADAGDEVLFHRDSVEFVIRPEDADCLILLSVNPVTPLDSFIGLLMNCAARQLPLLTPSRDSSTVTVHGVFSGLERICSTYEMFGGKVINFGKPEICFYEQFFQLINGIHPSKVLAIGDQLKSDILGGNRCGFDTLLVGTGASDKIIHNLLTTGHKDNKLYPTYFCQSLRP